jgi:cbb3-type cytochrome oxidase subunit 3
MAAPNVSASPTADLSQLKDIHLPHAISDWPIAFGWWTLLILTILSLCVTLYLWRRYKVNNANKKAALQLLRLKYQRFKDDSDSQDFLKHSNQILKRYCLKQYPAAVSLSGLAWTDFLILHSAKTVFNKELAYAMSEGLYQHNCKYDADELYNACFNWLKNNQQVAADVTLEHSKGHSTGHAND